MLIAPHQFKALMIGLDKISAFSSIRFSIGKFNTKKEMDIVIHAVRNVVNDLRAMVN